MNFGKRRLLVEQIVVVPVLGCGIKVDAMWHVPQPYVTKAARLKDHHMLL